MMVATCTPVVKLLRRFVCNHIHCWPVLLLSMLYANRARQLYKNISMLFLFPVKHGKLSTGVNATFNASCYG